MWNINKSSSLLKYLLMILLMWYLLASGSFDFALIIDFLNKDTVIAIFIIFVLWLLHDIIFSKRYQILLCASNIFIKLKNIVKIVFVGLFFNNLLPGGAGADIARIAYIKLHADVPIPVGTVITLLDRVFGLIGLIISTIIAIFITICFNHSFISVITAQMSLFAVVISLTVAIIAGLIVLRMPTMRRLSKKILLHKYLSTFFETVQSNAINAKIVLRILFLCVMGQICTLMSVSILAYVLYGKDAIFVTLTVCGVIQLASALPITPGNLGWTEWIADELYRMLGVEGGAMIFLLIRVLSICYSLVGSIIYLRISRYH